MNKDMKKCIIRTGLCFGTSAEDNLFKMCFIFFAFELGSGFTLEGIHRVEDFF